VRLSVLDVPVSVAAVMSGALGVLGTAVSMITALSAPEAALRLPATSVALAVMLYVPSASAVVVTE
jgi:hypothetical protein